MHDSVEIKKVPGKVLSNTFRDKVEGLTSSFQSYSLENTDPPKKSRNKDKKGKGAAPEKPKSIADGDPTIFNPEDQPPQPYFSVKIQFYGNESNDPSLAIVYPPLGKHIFN